jgi:hypothetical protein
VNIFSDGLRLNYLTAGEQAKADDSVDTGKKKTRAEADHFDAPLAGVSWARS